MTSTKSEAAAAVRIGAGLALRKRAELLGLLRPCFARTGPWLQAGKYAAAVMSELPERNGWSIARHAGDRTPDKTQRLLNHASWDDHVELNRKLKKNCDIADKPTAALIQDLKQRGMLEDTLVVWAGEFGRTPMVEIRNPRDAENGGRDHHPLAYSLFLAGGGIKGGTVVGKTDELCMNVTEDKVHVHDLQATLLHCLGLEHTRLTFHHMGRDFRLTDVEGKVVSKMLA